MKKFIKANLKYGDVKTIAIQTGQKYTTVYTILAGQGSDHREDLWSAAEKFILDRLQAEKEAKEKYSQLLL